MIARVRGPIAASSRRRVHAEASCGSTSTNTGTAPWWSTAIAVATKVKAGTMTSSPARTPAPTSARWSAEVPLLVARQYLRPDEGGELPLQPAHLGGELAGEHAAVEHPEHRAPLVRRRAPASGRAPPAGTAGAARRGWRGAAR